MVDSANKTKTSHTPPAAPPYKPMDTCPKHVGKVVRLTPDGKVWIDAKWRMTRTYSAKEMRWVLDSFWTLNNSGGGRITIDPIGWEEASEY